MTVQTATLAQVDVLPLDEFRLYVANRWYAPSGPQRGATGALPGAGSIRLFPGFIKQKFTSSQLGVRVTTGSAGNIQAAVYGYDPATLFPTGNALVSTASMSTGSGTNVAANAAYQFVPDLYWFATNCDNGTAVMAALDSANTFTAQLIGSATQGSVFNSAGASLQGLSVAQAFGSWPDLTSGSFSDVVASSVPLVEFKVGSVP